MTKQELQDELTAKGIAFDKRWAEPKLKMALEEAVEDVSKPEDKIEEIESKSEERREEVQKKVERPVLSPEQQKQAEARVVELRKNANEILSRSDFMKVNDIKRGREVKGETTRFKTREVKDGIEIYADSGKYVRIYTKKDHGDKYKELADKFIKTRQ